MLRLAQLIMAALSIMLFVFDNSDTTSYIVANLLMVGAIILAGINKILDKLEEIKHTPMETKDWSKGEF